MYRGLLRAFEHANSVTFVRALVESADCDRFNDLSELRAAYQRHIGMDSVMRIVLFDETAKDYRRANQACVHHHTWTRRELTKNLGIMDFFTG